ncbi:MAG: alkaline phosphatase family protein [Acidobacteria bacterium]|nr:alkaline phosphatase family protein [Acidobacteriota bacterium]
MRLPPASRAFLLASLLIAAPAAAVGPDDRPPLRPRLIEIKVDGLSPLLVDALMNPNDPEKLGRLPDPEGLRRAIALFRQQTGQQDLLPNLRRYFYEQGVRAENMFSATVTLSSVAWSVIDTGQPSVVKRHMSFSRQTGYLRSHLDAFRDLWDITTRRGRKTNALWELDQAGLSLFADAFHPLRRYETPQIYYRLTPRDYLAGLAHAYFLAGEKLSDPWAILRRYLSRRVEGMDYPDFNEDYIANHIAEKILEPDFLSGERYDYLSLFFSIDHQQHVDPNPENLVHRLVRLDRRIGRILAAVERSQRHDQTLVALVSDHGSEYEPGAINLAWPITRMFRTRLFGGHTVATVMTEDAGRALSTPIPGVDFPRVYESPFSPYGKGAGPLGEDDYTTAFIDNFGNARAEVHLRNNDLNRLHLLLLARSRKLDEPGRARLLALLQATLADIRGWLEPELADYQAYFHGVRAWLPALKSRRDPYWRDAAVRLEEENKLDAAQLRVLARLAELCRADNPLAWLEERSLDLLHIIPRKYFGPRNSIYQLTHYTLGLDENLNWVETTLDPRGRRVPMDYFSLLAGYRVPNPPASQEPNPNDLIVSALPVGPLRSVLVERGWLDPTVALRQVTWIVSTAENNLHKGDQALLLEATDGRLRYLPVRHLREEADGRFAFEPPNELDPLGLLYDPEFHAESGEPAFLWLEGFHTPGEWLRAACNSHYSIAPVIIADIAGLHSDAFVDNPDFQQTLTGFPSEEAKQRYLRGLRRKYTAQRPDFLLWSSYLWNYSSKSHTSGGSHGGLTPQVTRTTFMLWGGPQFHLPTGAVVEEPATTLDIVPTLARLLGMLADDGRAIRQAGAVRERPLFPYPGQLLPLDYRFAGRPPPSSPGTAPTAGASAKSD